VKVGVLTGGGDCPGLNAVIRAVARRSFVRGHEVVGVGDHDGMPGGGVQGEVGCSSTVRSCCEMVLRVASSQSPNCKTALDGTSEDRENQP